MTGKVYLKDFESGTYKNIKITVHPGSSFDDITNKDVFAEYIINTEDRSIISEKIFNSKSLADKIPTYAELMNLFDSSRRFFFKHTYAVLLEYKGDGKDFEFRTAAENHGKFRLPSLYNYFRGNSVYIPLKTFTFKLKNGKLRGCPLEADVYAELLNFTFCYIFDDACCFFYQAGGTLFLDVGSIIKNPMQRHLVRKRLKNYRGAYKFALKSYRQRAKVKVPFFIFPRKVKMPKINDETFEITNDIIYEETRAKTDALKIAAEVICTSKGGQLIENVFDIFKNKELENIAKRYYYALCEVGDKLSKYGYLKDEDYKYFDVYDILFADKNRNFCTEMRKRAEYFKKSAELSGEKYIAAYDGKVFLLHEN